jgi:hypothetical protein
MLAHRWKDVRVVMPMIAMWTGGLALISLFYLPSFDFSRGQVLVWFGAYIAYPLIAIGLLWTHRRESGDHTLEEPTLPKWVRYSLSAQGGLMAALGLGLLFATGTLANLWPWRTGPLMLQLYSAPLLSYGIGSFILARQRTWAEIRIALFATSIFTGAELAACLVYRALLNGPALSILIWFAWLALTTANLAFLSVLAFKANAGLQPALRLSRTPAGQVRVDG